MRRRSKRPSWAAGADDLPFSAEETAEITKIVQKVLNVDFCMWTISSVNEGYGVVFTKLRQIMRHREGNPVFSGQLDRYKRRHPERWRSIKEVIEEQSREEHERFLPVLLDMAALVQTEEKKRNDTDNSVGE